MDTDYYSLSEIHQRLMEDKMTLNEYQKEALKTLNKGLNDREVLIDGVMGLNGEAGECIDIVKKHLFQGHDFDRHAMIKELGDVMWYLAVTAYAIDCDLEAIAKRNILKLRERYPNGFEEAMSINREEV